jgi:hypothetical protein
MFRFTAWDAMGSGLLPSSLVGDAGSWALELSRSGEAHELLMREFLSIGDLEAAALVASLVDAEESMLRTLRPRGELERDWMRRVRTVAGESWKEGMVGEPLGLVGAGDCAEVERGGRSSPGGDSRSCRYLSDRRLSKSDTSFRHPRICSVCFWRIERRVLVSTGSAPWSSILRFDKADSLLLPSPRAIPESADLGRKSARSHLSR